MLSQYGLTISPIFLSNYCKISLSACRFFDEEVYPIYFPGTLLTDREYLI